MSEKNIREDKEEELEIEAINQAVKLFPNLGRGEALTLMTILNALGPLLDRSQYTQEHTALERLGGNVGTRRSEVRNNPIADVKAYNPKTDPNW